MRRHYAILALGVVVCLAGAFLMAWGDPIVGENHTGIATVVGILGLGIITSANTHAIVTRSDEGL